jgi:ribonuclease P protein component
MAEIAHTLGSAERIRKRPDFERVYNQGLKTPGRFMTLFLLRNGSSVSRLGIAATRKLGGAVQRNRAKRLAREIFRRHKPPPGLDLVVIPRREFLNVELASLEAEYQSIVSRRAARAPVVSAGRTGADRAKPGGARRSSAQRG